MTGTQPVLADLLAECDVHSIRLSVAEAGGLEIDAPQDALTPDLLARLKAHKEDVLAILRPVLEVPASTHDAPAKPPKAVCRCGLTTWRDVPIHGGQSVRRDCERCRRFLDFPVWYGKNALRNEQ